MGVGRSQVIHDVDFEQLSEESRLPVRDVKHLYARYNKLDRAKKGYVDKEALLKLPELAMNPLQERIVSLFDPMKRDKIAFKAFVAVLSAFSEYAREEDKKEVAFAIYDVDGDGYINKNDLTVVLKMLVGEHMTDDELNKVVLATIIDYDTDGDGKISKYEFSKFFQGSDMVEKMTIEFGD